MNTLRLFSGFALVAGALLINQVVVAVPGALTIATEPLFLKSRVKPAFIMAVDDSGSMNWETLFPTQDGEATFGRDTNGGSDWGFFRNSGSLRKDGQGFNPENEWTEVFPFPGRDTDRRSIPPTDNFGFARSPDFNAGYYDPKDVYSPWLKADKSSWESLDTPAEWQSVKVDARRGTTVAGTWNSTLFNLTANVRLLPVTNSNSNASTGSNDYDFDYLPGMVIPAGTEYYDDCSGVTGTNNAWNTAATNITLTGACDLAIRYFPATYYLTTGPTAPDGNTAGVLISSAPGGKAGLYRYEIKPGNYPGGAGGTAYPKAMTNFANWFTYYRSRNLALVAALTTSFNDIEFMRAGYFEINNRTAVTMYDLDPITGNRSGLYTAMTKLNATGGTPNRSAVEYLGAQFTDSTVNAVQIACQVNAGMLFTDGYTNETSTITTGNVDGGMGSPFADAQSGTIADIAARYYLASLRTGAAWDNKMDVPAGCNPNSPLQDCRDDPHMNFYGITLGALGDIYGTGAYINNPSTKVDEALSAVIASPPIWTATGTTNNQLANVDDIWHGTINGRGKFINANSPAAVTAAIREVLGSVADQGEPSGSQSVTGARLSAGSFNVTPAFGRRNDGKDWYGSLTANRINAADGSDGAVLWNATDAGNIPAYGARNIWTAITNVNSTNRATAVKAFNVGVGLNAASIGVTAANLVTYGATEQQIFDYLRGDTSLEGTKLRSRSTRLGDIVDSIPQIASAKDDYGWALASGLSAAAKSSYTTYLNTTGSAGKKDRKSFVYVGANDGMLHAFDGSTTPCVVGTQSTVCPTSTSGKEVFGYVPNGVLNKTGLLANPDYQHQYYVDGGLAVGDVYSGSSWSTMLVGATGAGGRSVFGLNVSDPDSFAASNVVWEVTGTSDSELGYVLGEPVIVPLDSGQWVALFGNGYNSVNSDPVLFVVDVLTGTVLAKVRPDDGDLINPNGLGNIAAIDSNNDGLVDTVYGGDLRGNVWKFSVNAAGVWSMPLGTTTPLFVATDPSGARQPITSGIEVSAGPGTGLSIFFGTGRYFVGGLAGDNSTVSPQVQSLYGIWDNNTAIAGGRGGLQLQSVTSETTASGKLIRSSTTNAVNYPIKRGWVLDLKVGSTAATGERFLGTPRLQNGKVFFTTFEPLRDECDPGGQNWLYSLDAVSGGAAMSQISLSSTLSPPVCTGSDCSAIALSTGAPVRETSVMTPPPLPLPGFPGGCIAGTPGCGSGAPPIERCTIVIRASGAPPLYLPRPCGRQSWRQVR